MSVKDLVPQNTQKAKSTAVNSFKRFLSDQHVALDHVLHRLQADTTGEIIKGVMDKFGMYLVTLVGRDGSPLSGNTIGSYYRHTKLWLLELYPGIRPQVDRMLLQMSATIERHVQSRDDGGFVNRAPACTKEDLKAMMSYLYTTANNTTDCLDATLLCLMWHLLGRASDLSMLQKSNLSRGPSSMFLRLMRLKTADEHGLTIFPDRTFETCPITAVVIALAVQQSPCVAVLPHLPSSVETNFVAKTAAVDQGLALIDILDCERSDGEVVDVVATMTAQQSSKQSPVRKSPGIHAHVNRVLSRILKPSGVEVSLTSHSFRRGGAQHANGSSEISLQWIFDRGAWSMSSTNKGLSYVFYTAKEDQMVAKVLSGWEPRSEVTILDLKTFDKQTQVEIRQFRDHLYASSSGFKDARVKAKFWTF
ncbi:Aste57867_25399 [Aphanomyces stellatus]|uniref:Aste57867_25399 protein n=1 Tax=Aphanomyces stellatus TaxID=120398 RepID=A0A485LXR2_9STRA|nr:hypothetical protein As57867_025320 [Aphanomyces stellatus]VFU02023.1 Aste57867_25399 [Aphanomyces stellatus]